MILKGTGAPRTTFTVRLATSGVVTVDPTEMPQVVFVGNATGQFNVTAPLNESSGTTCNRNVAAKPGSIAIW